MRITQKGVCTVSCTCFRDSSAECYFVQSWLLGADRAWNSGSSPGSPGLGTGQELGPVRLWGGTGGSNQEGVSGAQGLPSQVTHSSASGQRLAGLRSVRPGVA